MRPEQAEGPGPVRTTCPYCGVGCGVLARKAGQSVGIAGDPDHPANFGRLCSKGSALGETLDLGDRLLSPVISGRSATWDEALDLVAARFADTIKTHGPDSVAFYVSGQLLTEDYYVANKLMKGFIGSGNIDTNSRLCMSSAVAGHKRAFGTDCVPGLYEDLEIADVVVLVGSNLAWCHPVLFQRILAAKEQRGTKIVAIDPRATVTTESADLHLPLNPGTDVALFNGLLREISRRGAINRDYVAKHTSGFDAAAREADTATLAEVARLTGLSHDKLVAFYDLFITNERVVTAFSQGVNQSTAGTDKVNAIINCHLATGRIGRPGMGPFSITGQPNAMGGREVGGLANMLACHMDIENAEHRRIVADFWKAPKLCTKPGLKAVDLMRAVGDGRIKALWIMATSPVDSMPDANAVRDAIKACPFVVVSEVVRNTDTSALAHVLLPSLGWAEKDGTVTNSERRISRQRAFLPPPGSARPDWWQMAEVSKRLGYSEAFAYRNSAEIFAEFAGLSGYQNFGTRDFDISFYSDITKDAYDALTPFQWPKTHKATDKTRFFADGGFFTADRKGRFIATPLRMPAAETSPAEPFVFNTGRIRDQWHTMTRTGKAARLAAHIAEPFVEVHPQDAAMVGLADADLAEVTRGETRIIVRTLITDRQKKGSVFAPMHWTDQFASLGRVNSIVPAQTDPVSGQPELKCATVAIRPFEAAWHGFAVAREKPSPQGLEYWTHARTKGGWRLECAAASDPADWLILARKLMSFDGPDSELVSYTDESGGRYRYAAFCGGQVVGAAFFGREPVAIARNFIAGTLDPSADPCANRLALLAGKAGAQQKDRGPTVCACFDVGRNEILEAFQSGKCASVAAIGEHLKAGSNCGSCRPEIGRLLSGPAIANVG